MIRYDTIRYDTIRYDTILYDTIKYVKQQKNQKATYSPFKVMRKHICASTPPTLCMIYLGKHDDLHRKDDIISCIMINPKTLSKSNITGQKQNEFKQSWL